MNFNKMEISSIKEIVSELFGRNMGLDQVKKIIDNLDLSEKNKLV